VVNISKRGAAETLAFVVALSAKSNVFKTKECVSKFFRPGELKIGGAAVAHS
jgi:hypothetical protein